MFFQDKEYPAKALQIAKLKRQQEILELTFKVRLFYSYQPILTEDICLDTPLPWHFKWVWIYLQ